MTRECSHEWKKVPTATHASWCRKCGALKTEGLFEFSFQSYTTDEFRCSVCNESYIGIHSCGGSVPLSNL